MKVERILHMGRSAAQVLEDILYNIVQALVDNENSIDIRVHDSESTIFFDVDVDRSDVGKLIGRNGKTAGALRHVLGAAGAKLKVRTILSIKDKRVEE